MRLQSLRLLVPALAAFAISSCGTDGPTAVGSARLVSPRVAQLAGPIVRISEIHYDNAGTDAGEAIEISGPAGMSLAGWSLVLYNGASTSLATYNTRALTATIPATCDARGVVVESYPVNGIQNGNPDGFALVDGGGAVVEFLSYGGVFTAANGPAAGMTSTDIGVAESGTTPVGSSLQRNEDGTWAAPAPHRFGICNDGTSNEEPPAAAARVVIAPDAATIVVGGTAVLAATAFDAADAAIPTAALTWSSLDEGRATVSGAGLVTGVAVGNARIVATAASGVADTATVTVEAAPPVGLPATRFSELHYDNDGVDAGEAIEIEGPAGTNLTGWSVVLYNQTGGVQYGTSALAGTIPATCGARGVVVINYPSNGIQNGPADGFALVSTGGSVVEFLSYEGTLTATNGPAVGMTSTDIGVSEASTSTIGRSLQRNAAGVWSGPATATLGVCNGSNEPPPPPANSISFSGRLASDAPLPIGFEDQLFATLRSGTGTTIPTTFTWSSDTPAIATIDATGVMRAVGAGTAVIRATAADLTTATYSLPTRVPEASTTAQYAGNAEFGEPGDGDASDDFIVRRPQYTASYSYVRGTPNWVSYNLEATHFGAEDRCDCFTFDPELPASFPRYTTADYTGAGTIAGYGIDRGHLARSFDRTSASLDNATTYYFTNIVPQAADNNQGPWAAMENYLGDLARFEDREVYIVTGVAGSKGSVKNEGRITIPAQVWKVALVLPRDAGLANVDRWDDATVIAVILPNDAGIRTVNWETYKTTVDAVEALSGYDLLALLRDDIEIAVESNTRPPTAALDGPWSAYAGDPLSLSGAASSDLDGDVLTYAWDFGDGASGAGVSPSHTYGGAGNYTVTLIVTDPLGLADTVSSSASITLLPPAVGVARAQGMVRDLRDLGALRQGEAQSLLAKLDAAARSIERGSNNAALGQLGALLNEVDALVRTGRLSSADAAALREVIERTRRNLGG